ncbi:unnamed protein product [Calypogeia fissa]
MAQPVLWHSPLLLVTTTSLQAPSSSSSSSSWTAISTRSSTSLSFSHCISSAPHTSFSNVWISKARRKAVAPYVCSLSTLSGPVEEGSIAPPPPLPNQEHERKKKPNLRQLILKPPLSDKNLAERFLASPQLQLKSFPLLSSCLPLRRLSTEDEAWMDEFLLEAKDALGYDLEVLEPREDSPASHLDTLLFLAFNHQFTARGRTKFVGMGHSRLWFLGQFVIELALCELFMQMYPRERVGAIRERVFCLTSKKVLPYWFQQASLDRILFHNEELEGLKGHEKQMVCRDVFWALVAATYLTLGISEVYRLLFEVFGMDLDAPTAQPRERTGLEDIDSLSPDLETKKTWQEIVSYKAPDDSLFALPRLFRACVPPGMHRFRGNGWEMMHLSSVREILNYPRHVVGSSREMTEARSLELDLGLQLCFLHPSKYKGDHPRFCFDRLEYLGSKIKDVVGAEQILMKHLDGPASWLNRKHRLQFLNRICGRTLREKRLHRHIIYGEDRIDQFERNRRLRNFATTSVQHSIHAIGYLVYGRREVRRLMYEVFTVDELVPAKFL